MVPDDGRMELCPRCQSSLDTCACRCPYCDETTLCDCAIGLGISLGGG